MTRVAQANRPAHAYRESDLERARGATRAVVALLRAGAFEVERPQPARPHELDILDGHHLRQLPPPGQLLPEHMPGKIARSGVILRPIALRAP